MKISGTPSPAQTSGVSKPAEKSTSKAEQEAAPPAPAGWGAPRSGEKAWSASPKPKAASAEDRQKAQEKAQEQYGRASEKTENISNLMKSRNDKAQSIIRNLKD